MQITLIVSSIVVTIWNIMKRDTNGNFSKNKDTSEFTDTFVWFIFLFIL